MLADGGGSNATRITWEMPARRRKQIGRYTIRQAGRAIRFGITAYRAYRRYKTIANRRRMETDGNGITTQYDRKLIYRYKRMPRGKKRVWKRFVRKTNAVIAKNLGKQQVLMNQTISKTIVASTQATGAVALYGKTGTNVVGDQEGMNDIQNIIINGAPDINVRQAKFMFTSAVLDCTCANTGANNLEIDVYEIIYTGKTAPHENIKSAYSYGIQGGAGGIPLPGTGAGYSGINGAERGWTPFMAATTSGMGWKILKKTKHFVGPGQAFTYQHRDPGNHKIDCSEILSPKNAEECAIPYLTKFLYFIGKAVIGTEGGSFAVGCTRTYNYVILESNDNKIGELA